MKKVFFGGSRKLGRLNQAIRERADNIIAKGYKVLIGDAAGADKAMQKYLADDAYGKVVVFCSGNVCRNNLGKWETRFVASDREKKDFRFYAEKDKRMSDEADYGFMLWDGESKGTLNNVINLLEHNKYVLIYFSPTQELITLRNLRDIDILLHKCKPDTVQRLDRALNMRSRTKPKQRQLEFA